MEKSINNIGESLFGELFKKKHLWWYSLYHMLKLDAYLIWERMRERLYGTDVLCTLVLSFVCEGR